MIEKESLKYVTKQSSKTEKLEAEKKLEQKNLMLFVRIKKALRTSENLWEYKISTLKQTDRHYDL